MGRAEVLVVACALSAGIACDDHLLGTVEPSAAYSCDWTGMQDFFADQQCLLCHYAGSPVAFDLVAALVLEIEDGDVSGPYVVAGEPEESRLWLSLTWEDPSSAQPMPQTATEPLDARLVEHVRCWIEDGAPLD